MSEVHHGPAPADLLPKSEPMEQSEDTLRRGIAATILAWILAPLKAVGVYEDELGDEPGAAAAHAH